MLPLETNQFKSVIPGISGSRIRLGLSLTDVFLRLSSALEEDLRGNERSSAWNHVPTWNAPVLYSICPWTRLSVTSWFQSKVKVQWIELYMGIYAWKVKVNHLELSRAQSASLEDLTAAPAENQLQAVTNIQTNILSLWSIIHHQTGVGYRKSVNIQYTLYICYTYLWPRQIFLFQVQEKLLTTINPASTTSSFICHPASRDLESRFWIWRDPAPDRVNPQNLAWSKNFSMSSAHLRSGWFSTGVGVRDALPCASKNDWFDLLWTLTGMIMHS